MKEFRPAPSFVKEFSIKRNQSQREKIFWQIPVDDLLEKYHARRIDGMPHTVENTIRKYPTLAYFLGTSSEILDLPRIDDVTKGVEETRVVKEGSGMFGLKDYLEAKRWRGIFNHSVGSTANAMFLAEKMKHLKKEDRVKAKNMGFDFSSFDNVSPKLFRDGWILLHVGRRRADETMWYGTIDENHTIHDPYENSLAILQMYNASPVFRELMSIEKHGGLIQLARSDAPIPVEVGVMLMGDWMFGQDQMTLKDRFASLRASKRESKEVLDTLETFGVRIEGMFQDILGKDIFDTMHKIPEPLWASRMKRAYASASGSTWDSFI